MDIIERTRPKGFNRNVWRALFTEALTDKAWALDIVKNKPEWSRMASTVSLKMLGERLALEPWELAKGAYEYLEMRAHGSVGWGALDPSARTRWHDLGGRKIGPKSQWKYDHTTHTTSASRKGKTWVDFRGKEIGNYKVCHCGRGETDNHKYTNDCVPF